MFVNKQKALQFLSSVVLEPSYPKMQRGNVFFITDTVRVLLRPPSKAFWRSQEIDIIWITLSYRVFVKSFRSPITVYFLKKEKGGYVLYDRRLLQGEYLLPPVLVSWKIWEKPLSVCLLEEKMFAFPKKSRLSLEKDSLFRLEYPAYLLALRTRCAQKKETVFLGKVIFQGILRLVDK